jgi:phage host-nuclease inhibitor protein Gam
MGKKDGIETREEAIAKMVELASEATRLATVLAERDEAIAAVNEKFADRIETGSKLVLALKAELKEWAKEHRNETEKGTQLFRFDGVGEIQIRTGNPEVRLARGLDEDGAVGRLFDAGLGGYVRTVQELNREALIADREDPKFARINTLGIRVGQTENVLFFVEGVGKV